MVNAWSHDKSFVFGSKCKDKEVITVIPKLIRELERLQFYLPLLLLWIEPSNNEFLTSIKNWTCIIYKPFIIDTNTVKMTSKLNHLIRSFQNVYIDGDREREKFGH